MLQVQVDKIYGSLFSLNNPAVIGSAETKRPIVEELIKTKITYFILQELPIQMVVPAFPAKSPNRDKTLGALPDFGEVLALQTLQILCDEIQSIYNKGAEILICSDGRVFSDLVGVTDSAVNAYKKGLSEIISRFNLRSIGIFDLDDIYSGLSFSQMREELVRQHADPLQRLRERIMRDASEKHLFNGIHRFIFEDRLVLDQSLGKSRNQIREESKSIAYEVVQRSQAWSKLVELAFPRALRLSIHPQVETSTKIPVRLLPGDHPWRTPWHGVVLKTGDIPALTTRKQAVQLGARYTENESGFGYFEAASC